MEPPKPCPLCERENCQQSDVPRHHSIQRVECPSCGIFAVHSVHHGILADYGEERFKISAVIRERTCRGHEVLLVCGPERPNVPGFETIGVDEALGALYPGRFSVRLDRALLNLAKLSKHVGHLVNVQLEADRALVFAQNEAESHYVLQSLVDAGLIKGIITRGSNGVIVTPHGWNRVADLEEARTGEPLVQGFVAMWFGNDNPEDCIDGVSSAQYLKTAFNNGFESGIDRAGYRAFRSDMTEYTDDAVAVIITEIRRSRFVVADFTGHRNGVYYEAGFALGLGLPVIFTCRSGHIRGAHFDTRNMNHLEWNDPADLASKLERWIVARIGDGPLRPQG